ncbi:MAG: Hpt domain-containing protein [Pseudomonadota bacterium]|nr:Hpt domain-containing protein [Pseudomonadota bacterium]
MDSNKALRELSNTIGVPEQTLQSILALFYNEHSQIREQTLLRVEQNSQQELATYIHKLKGSSGSLQMHGLRQSLVLLEERLKLGQKLTVEDLEPLYLEMDFVIKQYQLDKVSAQS